MLQMPSTSMGSPMGMEVPSIGAFGWAPALYGLGGLLLVTGVLGVTRRGMRQMRVLGVSMLIYGLLMLTLGALMLARLTPAMQEATMLGIGMGIVGVSMLANGFLMMRHGALPRGGM